MMRFERISAKELDGYLGRKDVCVIDLRSPDEYVMRISKERSIIPTTGSGNAACSQET